MRYRQPVFLNLGVITLTHQNKFSLHQLCVQDFACGVHLARLTLIWILRYAMVTLVTFISGHIYYSKHSRYNISISRAK